MSLTPRITLNEEFIKGMKCAICGNPNLTITHIEKYPDFVTCNRCGAAFVVENEGSWVMYGKIPAEYPQTREFALRQWTWLDAVAQRAEDEREEGSAPSFVTPKPAEEPEATPPPPEESTPPPVETSSADLEEETRKSPPAEAEIRLAEISEDLAYPPPVKEETETQIESDLEAPPQVDDIESPSDELSSLDEVLVPTPFEPIDRVETEEEDQIEQADDERFPMFELSDDTTMEEVILERPDTTAAFPIEETVQQEPLILPHEQRAPTTAEVRHEARPSSIPVGEPEPDKRFRVTIRGNQTKYPHNYCAHCLRTPVKLKVIMRGNLPDPSRPGKRKLVPLKLPFCKDCQKRMNAQSDEEKNARLLAFLISGLIAVIAIVGTLASGMINLQENLTFSIIILLTVAILGFSVSLMVSLSWASKHPPPRDAAFVLSTLIVNESGDDLTDFEWRNPGYAELFRQVNQANAVGEVVPIQDRVTFTEIPPEKIRERKEQKPKPKPKKKKGEEDRPMSDPQEET
jgi:hypothetical protein